MTGRRKALGCPTEDRKECGMCESVIRENCTKFVPKSAVALALEKALACKNMSIRPQHISCDNYFPHDKKYWCPNCRARKAVMDLLGKSSAKNKEALKK